MLLDESGVPAMTRSVAPIGGLAMAAQPIPMPQVLADRDERHKRVIIC